MKGRANAGNMGMIARIQKVAYLGEIGRVRRLFCTGYIEKKAEKFREITAAQEARARDAGKVITCRKGCPSCCSLYVEAGIQECETIVYYLYQHEEVLGNFLDNYPGWHYRFEEDERIFKSFAASLESEKNLLEDENIRRVISFRIGRHLEQDNPCPFLSGGVCSIYEVRPYLCAGHYVVSPVEWCNPRSGREPEFGNTALSALIFDKSFYYHKLDEPYLRLVPLAVYEILTRGTWYLSGVPGLATIDHDFRRQPAVKRALRGKPGA